MSGLEGLAVIGAVAAVVSAFHGGAELVAHIKKKRKRRSSKSQTQQDFEEKQLQDSLETGETQVARRFAADLQQFGDVWRKGDAIARDRLLHITIVMQAEVIKSLQLAAKFDNVLINLTTLHEASILNRKDAITTLDEMKQRILLGRPVPRIFGAAAEDERAKRASIASVQTLQSSNITPDFPPTLAFPVTEDTKDTKTGLAKYFSSVRRNNSQSSTSSQHRHKSPASSAGDFTISPALDYLFQGNDDRATIMKDIDEIISAYQGLQVDRDSWDASHGGGSNRDTLAILQGGDGYKRDTMGLNRDALQIPRNLPPTPEEGHEENTEYPAYNYNVFDQQPTYGHHFAAPNPLPQLQTSPGSRVSTSSSVYSDNVPPSLYSHDSKSSRDSHTPPPLAHEHAPHSSSASPSQAFVRLEHPRAPPQPPLQPPFAAPQRPRTPPIQYGHGALKAGKTQVRLVPDHQLYSAGPVFPSTPGRPALSQGAIAASAVNAATPIVPANLPPPPPPPPPPPGTTLQRGGSQSSSMSGPSIHSSTIQGPLAGAERMMDGRPCKDNNYWGFCKGAWAVREEIKKGLALETRPTGMYNTRQVWQCRQCHFQGDTFTVPHPTKKNRKETVVDPSARTSAVGIRYRWMFLAKSHVKKTTMEGKGGRATGAARAEEMNEDCNYGCLICSVQGNVTGIFGNVETLMNHIFLEHARNMDDKTLWKSKCIVGRLASSNEEWDLNIPKVDGLLT